MRKISLIALGALLITLLMLPLGHAYKAAHGKAMSYSPGACPPEGCPPYMGQAPMGGGFGIQSAMGPYPPMMGGKPITKCKPPMNACLPSYGQCGPDPCLQPPCPPPQCGPVSCAAPPCGPVGFIPQCKPPVRWY